jgi:PAS domain S-box-containing protein
MKATSKSVNLRHPDAAQAPQFYDQGGLPVDDLSKVIGTRLLAGGAAIVIGTKAHSDDLARGLKAMGLDLARAASEGRYRTLVAADALPQFMVDGLPDPTRFSRFMEMLISAARASSREGLGLVIASEMSLHLSSEGNSRAAIHLQQLWQDLANVHALTLYRAYPANVTGRQENRGGSAESPNPLPVTQQGVFPVSSTGTPEAAGHLGVLVDALTDFAIFILDTEGRVTSFNGGKEQFPGYAESEIVSKSFSCLYPREEAQEGKPQRDLETAANAGRFEEDGWRVCPDGSRFWARTIITPLKDASGKLYGYAHVIRDITENQRAELAFHRSEQQLRHFVNAVQEYAIFMLDRQGRITTWNSGARRINGYTASEIIGCHLSCFYTQEDLQAQKPQKELKIAAEKGSVEDEGWRVRKDGSRFWANVIITAVRDESGELIGFAKVTRDVTERVQAARSLRESERRYRTVAEAAADAIVTTSSDLRIQFVNPATTQIFGYGYSELIGRSLARLIPACAAGLQDNWTSNSRQAEVTGLRKGNGEFPAEISVAESEKDGERMFIYFIRDISDRKRAERRLSESEESLRKLSLFLLRSQDEERRRIGRELHDSLGQRLVAIKMELDILSPSIPADSEAGRQLAECCQRAEEAIKELRTISYLMYPPMLDDLGLQSAVAWYIEGFAQRSEIPVNLEVGPDFGRLAQEAELAMFRVLQESLTNVHRHSGSPTAQVRLFNRGDTACLEVTDHGKGLPESTRAESGGDAIRTLGVGLRGMDERLRQLGGKLEIISSPGKTTILACIPRQEAAPGAPPPSATSRPN